MLFSIASPGIGGASSIAPRASRSVRMLYSTRCRCWRSSAGTPRGNRAAKARCAVGVTAVSTACAMASRPVQAVTPRGCDTVSSGSRSATRGGRLRVAAGHLLVGLLVGDQGERLALAARARPWWERRSAAASAWSPCRRPSNPASCPPFVSRKLQPLAVSMLLPPPRPMMASMSRRSGPPAQAGVHVARGRVLAHAVEDDAPAYPLASSDRRARSDVARRDDPRIRDQQRSPRPAARAPARRPVAWLRAPKTMRVRGLEVEADDGPMS